jgi:flagellar protein FlaJ
MRRLADAEGTYGPVAGEFGKVVADTEWFDRDLFTALAAARDRTPSGECAVFLDEFVSVLRTGGDVGEFLQGEARDNLDAAQERQAELLDDLDTLAEVYVVFVFAGPVFLLVVLLVVSFVQPDVLGVMRALVYLLIPVAILGFLGVFFWLMEPYRAHTESPGGAGAGHGRDSFDGPPDDGRLDSYEADRESSTVERLRTETLATLRERPSRILSVTVPLGILVAATTVFFTPAEEAVARTAGVLAVPFLLSAVPYGALYERKRRHQRAVRRRFPDALEVVGEAVDNRVPLGDAFGLVAQRAGGDLARELSRLHRDVTWTHDVRGALSRFADRAGVPQISRTVRLLEESVRATDDLGPILRLVSEDLDRRNTIRRERRHRMQPYVIIVVLGFVVYLAIVVMFDSFFLPVVAERAAAATDLRGSTLRIDPASLAAYRRLFFHSALVQAVGNGLLLGKLLDDRLRSGVGYAALLTAMALVTFLVLA